MQIKNVVVLNGSVQKPFVSILQLATHTIQRNCIIRLGRYPMGGVGSMVGSRGVILHVQDLLSVEHRLELDISVKANSLRIDKHKCLGIRWN